MEIERNNGNDSVIFEISSKGENTQNINRYTEKKEQQLSYQGINLEQYLHIINKTRKEIEDNYKEQAEKNVK